MTAAVLAALAASMPAQQQFVEFPGRLPVDNDQTLGVALGDVDGDGDLDLMCGNVRQNRLYLNDSNGNFTDVTATHMPVRNDATISVAMGDVDGDGDLDVVGGNLGQQNRLYVNDGSGIFTDVTGTQIPAGSDATTSVALGDVDGDHDLDLVVGNNGAQQDRLYLNDGTGTFIDATAAQMPVNFLDNTTSLALGDVDGDRDLDVVLGGLCYGKNRLYLNDGTGTFMDATAAQMPAVNADLTMSLALGDVDEDSDLDLVAGNTFCGVYCSPDLNRLYLNDGTATFKDLTATRMPMISDRTMSVALGDLDGDGDLDLVTGNNGGQNRLYLNLLRQLDTLQSPTVGQTFTLDAYARYGAPRLVDVALPYVSSATAQIPLPPFGTVGIDPAFAIPLSPFVIPQPAGMGSVTETIPNNSSLVGLSIHGQALLLQWPGPAYLTNVTSDRIAR